jgi:U4/U6 small nuclear ribonucleoprotein PRP31
MSQDEPEVELKLEEALSTPRMRAKARLRPELGKKLSQHAKVREVLDLLDSGGLSLLDHTALVSESVDFEIISLHKALKEEFSEFFPELERLVPQASDFASVVRALTLAAARVHDAKELESVLRDFVSAQTVMVIQMTISRQFLLNQESEERKKSLVDTCAEILDLIDIKMRIFRFTESLMEKMAPNLSAVVGCGIAARLISASHGLKELAVIPGGYLMFVKDIPSNPPILTECDIVIQAPSDLKKKAMKLLSAKAALAARIDYSAELSQGRVPLENTAGRSFREMIEDKLVKAQQPPDKKKKRPLPAPIDKPRKRRGGRRFRKMKEKFKLTELMKQKNRLAFGVATEDDYQTGVEMGMIGVSGSGIRIGAEDTQKLSKGMCLAILN